MNVFFSSLSQVGVAQVDDAKDLHFCTNFQGTIGCTPKSVPMVFSWCSLGILGDYNHQYPLYRAYIGISHRGTLVGVHPTVP